MSCIHQQTSLWYTSQTKAHFIPIWTGTPCMPLHGTPTQKEASEASLLIPSTSMCPPPVPSTSSLSSYLPTSNSSSLTIVSVLTIRLCILTNLPPIKSHPTAPIAHLSTSLPPGLTSSTLTTQHLPTESTTQVWSILMWFTPCTTWMEGSSLNTWTVHSASLTTIIINRPGLYGQTLSVPTIAQMVSSSLCAPTDPSLFTSKTSSSQTLPR